MRSIALGYVLRCIRLNRCFNHCSFQDGVIKEAESFPLVTEDHLSGPVY